MLSSTDDIEPGTSIYAFEEKNGEKPSLIPTPRRSIELEPKAQVL
jgi:hypothetical protein